MNPFLHSTVAQPLPVARAVALPVQRHRTHLPSAPRVARVLRAAGLAALTWAGAAGAVDLNTATLDQLRGIRGIGPKTAQIILDERTRGGRYLSFADLSDRVRGIGPRRAQALQSAGLTIDGGGTRLSGQGAAAAQAVGGILPGAKAASAGAPVGSQTSASKR
ncbi:MAG: helix-hairpin-helix domain-containing protein [Castellaniella sp.]|uniref:ComEA family DNA-binding protein n=1 Tax=Castellaniella sp. TaxID=1955812 RepID=UPI003C75B55E